MRLVRFGEAGSEKPGVLNARDERLDVSSHFLDWNGAALATQLPQVQEVIRAEGDRLPRVPESVRWGAPIARPWKVVCVGLNYSDHAAEAGQPVPKEPILFLKGSNTVIGPYDDVLIPRKSEKTDWEIELGVVIGKTARYVATKDDAREHIAGYCISHDVSERAFQMERGGQWTKGKSCDTFNPLGPWLTTPDDLPNVRSLSLELMVNNEVRQRGNTAKMIFDVYEIVRYVSQFMTLEPGDLITTGTPPGVGLGMKPPQYLRPGDIVELSIEGLGHQRQRFRNAEIGEATMGSEILSGLGQ